MIVVLPPSETMYYTCNKLFLEHMQQLRIMPVMRRISYRVQLYDSAGPRRRLLRHDLYTVVEGNTATFFES